MLFKHPQQGRFLDEDDLRSSAFPQEGRQPPRQAALRLFHVRGKRKAQQTPEMRVTLMEPSYPPIPALSVGSNPEAW